LRKKIFLYSLLILLSGIIYAMTGLSFVFLISGVCLAASVANGYFVRPLIFSAIAITVCTYAGDDCGFSFLLGGLLPGAVIGTGFRKKLSLSVLCVSGGMCFILKWVYLFRSYYIAHGTNMFEDASNEMLALMKSNLSSALELSGLAADENTVNTVSTMLDAITKITNLIVPAVLIILSCGAAFIIIMIAKNIVYKNRTDCHIPSFSKLYVPGSLMPALLISLLGLLAKERVAYFFANILLVIFVYISVCGLSVIDFYFRNKVGSSAARVILYTVIGTALSMMLPQLLYMGLFIAGISDVLFDFRHIRPHKHTEN